MLLQFTTARIITNHDDGLLQFTTGTLLQITTTVITIYDRYHNSWQLLLQFTTGITIYDVNTIYDSTPDQSYSCSKIPRVTGGYLLLKLQSTPVTVDTSVITGDCVSQTSKKILTGIWLLTVIARCPQGESWLS